MSLDLLGQLQGFEENGQFRFTPPTHTLLAFDQALREWISRRSRWARRAVSAEPRVLMQGMSRLGFRAYLKPSRQSHIVTAFHYPNDPKFDFADFYRRLRDRGLIIYPGKVSQADSFRIGCIGHIFESDMRALLSAIAETLAEMGFESRRDQRFSATWRQTRSGSVPPPSMNLVGQSCRFALPTLDSWFQSRSNSQTEIHCCSGSGGRGSPVRGLRRAALA